MGIGARLPFQPLKYLFALLPRLSDRRLPSPYPIIVSSHLPINLAVNDMYQGHTVQDVRSSPVRNRRVNLLEDLSIFVSSIYSNNFDIKSVTSLLKKVVANAPDADIWNAVHDFVTQFTPPPRPQPILDQTPWLQTTSSFVNSSCQTNGPE